MIDQFILYDQMLVTWLNDNVAPLAVGRSSGVATAPNAQILIATPRKQYAEVTTGRVVSNETLTFPRISIARLDHMIDPERFNCNRIRRLGWCDSPVRRRLRSARYPTPVHITWQVDFRTRFVTEMNRWEQYLLTEFAPGYLYQTIRVDDVWGDKYVPIFMEGGLSDNSDLDAGEGDRTIRRTVSLRANGWLFDQNYIAKNIIKRFQLEYWDETGSELFDRSFLPPLEVIGTGDGSQVTFSGILNRPPVLEHTPVVQTVIGGSIQIAQDDGAGAFLGDNVASGTITYSSGVWSITFSSPPDAGEDISITYFTDLS